MLLTQKAAWNSWLFPMLLTQSTVLLEKAVAALA
jgi:hypothetical protein